MLVDRSYIYSTSQRITDKLKTDYLFGRYIFQNIEQLTYHKNAPLIYYINSSLWSVFMMLGYQGHGHSAALKLNLSVFFN